MTIFKLFGKRLLEVCHSAVKLFLCDVHIVNLYVEILTSRETVAFIILNFIVSDNHRKVVNSLAVAECADVIF